MSEATLIHGYNGMILLIPLAACLTGYLAGLAHQRARYHARGKWTAKHVANEPRLKMVDVKVHEANPYRKVVG